MGLPLLRHLFQLPFRDSVDLELTGPVRWLLFQLPFRDSVSVGSWEPSQARVFQLPFRDSVEEEGNLQRPVYTFNSLFGIPSVQKVYYLVYRGNSPFNSLFGILPGTLRRRIFQMLSTPFSGFFNCSIHLPQGDNFQLPFRDSK